MSGSQGAVNILQDSSSEEEEEGPFEDAHSPEEMSEYKEHEKLTLNIEATEQADEQESDEYESPDSPEPIWSPPAINPPIPTSPPQSEQITPQTPEETFEGTVYQNVNPGGVPTVGPDNQCLSGVKDKVSIDRTLYQNWDPDDARTEDPGNVCQASAKGQTLTSQTVYQNVGSDGMQTEGLIEDNEGQAGVKGQALRSEMVNQNSDDSKTGGPDNQCQAKAEESEEQIWDPEQVKNSQAFDTQSQPDQHDQWSSGSKEDQTPEDAPPPVPARTYVKPQLPPRVSKNLHPSSDSTNMGSDYVDPRSSAQMEATKPVTSSDFPPSYYTPQQNFPHSNPQNYPPSSSAQPNVSNPNVPNPDMMYGNPYTSMPFPSFSNMAPGQFSFPGGENEFAQQMMQLQYYYSQLEQNKKTQTQTSQNANNSNKGNETLASNLDESISKSSDQDTSLPTNNPNSDQKHPKKKKAKKEPKHHSKPQHEKDQSEATAKATEETAKDLFVYVSNINPETDEETFSDFLERKAEGDAEFICVVYTEDKSTAVGEFSTPVDITEIQNKCKKKPLKGKYLEVCSVDPVRYIVVSAEGDDVSGDDLKKYFENKAQSDGGNVLRVFSKGDGCFTVKFKQEEDALRVCRKSCHMVSDTTLIVTPLFFPELGDNCNGIYDVSKHTVPLPSALIIENVDVQIKDFLKQSNPVVEQLNLELKKKHAKVVCDEKIQVECLLDQKMPNVRKLVKTWETEARESFFETVSEMIHKADIGVMKEAWSETAKDLFVYVSNINPETDEETFSYFLERKAEGDAEVICVVYTEDKSTAVVEFSTPVDITEIQNKCKKKPLKGKYLEVCSVDPVRYIVVSAEGDNVTGDDLKKYFENKAQSDGGNVHRVTSKDDGFFTVKFKKEEDALRVCRKSCHMVSDTTLIVTPLFFPELGDNCYGIYDVSKHTVPLPSALYIENVDVQIEDFIKQSIPVVEQLNLELKKKHAKVVCDEKIQVECLLDQKMPNVRKLVKTWETEARESLFETVSEMIHKADIGVMKEAWSETAKDLFVYLSNINPETDEETFSYFLERRAEGDAEVICAVYTEDKSTAVVEFSIPVDITEIQNTCKKKPLNGNYLEVHSVDPVRHIVVSAEGDNVTGDDLKKYFENTAQSDGGNVHRVTSIDDGFFTVKFKKEEDALRVCKKSCHVVLDINLIVTPLFFPELGDDCYGIYDVSKHTVLLPSALYIEHVDVQIKDFLKQSIPVVEQLNLELKKKHAKVVCDEKIQVECLLDQKMPNVRRLVKTWETEARKSFFETVSEMIHKAEIEVMKEAWSEVQCSATKITEIHSSDHLLTVYEEDTSKILFVGKKMIVHTVHTEIRKQYREIEKKIQRQKQITSEEKPFPIPNIRLMNRSGIFEELEMISEDFKVEADYQNGKINFTGVKDDIMIATVLIYEQISDFENWIISVSEKLSKHQLELLAGEPAKSLLQEKFQENGLTVEIEFHDDAVKVYTINSNERSQAESIIFNMTRKSVIPLDETLRHVLLTRAWRIEIEALCSEHENKVKVFPKGQDKIIITTTRDIHDYVKQRLENFIRKKFIFEDSVVMEDAGIMKFISKYCGTQVKEIEEKYRDYFVKLALEEKKIIMSGTKEGLSMAKPEIQAIIKKIHYEEKTYSQTGMSKILTQDKLPVTNIEDGCRSVIGPRNAGASSESDDVRPKQRFIPVPSHKMLLEEGPLRGASLLMFLPLMVKTGPYICAENNIKIELIRGDLVNEKGDVIVCSVAQDLHLNRGKSSKTLLDKGGQGLIAEIEIKYPNGSQAGELAIISGGSLGCQELYLGYLTDWKSSKGKVLTEFMRKCLEAANDSSYTTLVFPAMGTGQLGYPRDQVAEIMYQTVIDFDRKSAGPNLKHIKFICFPGDLETCEAFEAEEKHRLNPHLPKQQIPEKDHISQEIK